jgi:hypothetical protein
LGETDRYDVGVRLSGPLQRDRLWFSAAVNPRWEVLNKTVVSFGPATERAAAVLFATKLTWRPMDAGQVELSVFGDPGARDKVSNLPGGMAAVANPDPLLTSQEFGGTVASLRATFTPTTMVLVEAAVARQWDRATVAPRTEVGYAEPLFVDDLTATIAGGPGSILTDERGRTSLLARVTWSLASHTVGAGIELARRAHRSSRGCRRRCASTRRSRSAARGRGKRCATARRTCCRGCGGTTPGSTSPT